MPVNTLMVIFVPFKGTSTLRNQPAMQDPLGYLLTWSTYGTWLPGDTRWWAKNKRGSRSPNPMLEDAARRRMKEIECILNPAQREVVEAAISDHCQIRDWLLHAVNCRSNHVHVVVSAKLHPKSIQSQLKAWSTRRLQQFEQSRATNEKLVRSHRHSWWTERGSQRYLNDEESLERAITYVREAQDLKRD